jgi:4'-phosphopantetheinyl transferase EntD
MLDHKFLGASAGLGVADRWWHTRTVPVWPVQISSGSFRHSNRTALAVVCI